MMKHTRRATLALATLALLATTASADVKSGNPKVKSVEAITFGPNGLLIIADGKGSQIVTVQTGDTTPMKWTKTEIDDIKEQLAGRLGTTAKGIEIMKLAVNPASQQAYVVVRKLEGKETLVMTVDPSGKVREFALDNVKYSAYPLAADDKVTTITDVGYADGRILVAAQASGTFSAKVFVIDTKQDNPEAVSVSTETYHVAHGKWETNAPIRTLIPYVEGNKKYLVGAFTCTPLVKYSLDDMKAGARVKGTSVIELGNGNAPKSMFTYSKDGKNYVLVGVQRMERFHKTNPVGPSPFWAAKVEYSVLAETEKVNEKALKRIKGKDASQSSTESAQVAKEFFGVTLMDKLDAERTIVIRNDDKGGVQLRVLMLP